MLINTKVGVAGRKKKHARASRCPSDAEEGFRAQPQHRKRRPRGQRPLTTEALSTNSAVSAVSSQTDTIFSQFLEISNNIPLVV